MSARRSSSRSPWRALTADRPSTASVLLGHKQGVQVFRKVSGWWGTAIGVMALVLSASLHLQPVEDVHVAGTLVIAIGATGLGLAYLLAGERASERSLIVLSLGALVAMVVEVGLLGPRFEMAMVVPALGCLQALFYLPRRYSLIGSLLVVASYAVLVLGTDGYPSPWARLLVFVTVLAATSTVLLWIVGRIETLSQRERAAQAELATTTQALAEANAQLEERVGQQGEGIGSLQRLRQFVSPQVAQALLDHGIEALAPHRCRIAVLFCDLRGFTTFSSVAEPEDVMETLQEYYGLVGRALQESGATVGSFAGDGVMAYFGDPVPCVDPAGIAVRMAVSLNEQMRGVVQGWRRRGFEVGCGMGLGYGFATVGPIGFDGRTDYTAVGATVNLASRLCDLAADGELLLDGRAWGAVEGRAEGEEVVLDVRGLPTPIRAHRVTAWADDRDAAVAPVRPLRSAG